MNIKNIAQLLLTLNVLHDTKQSIIYVYMARKIKNNMMFNFGTIILKK